MTDIQLTESQRAAISALMRDEGAIPPPLHLARRAHLRHDAVERDRARRDPDGFWASARASASRRSSCCARAEAGPGLVAALKDHVRQDLAPIAQPSEAGRGPGRPLHAGGLSDA